MARDGWTNLLSPWSWSRVVALAGLALVIFGGVRALSHPATLPAEPRDWVLAVVGLLIGARVAAYEKSNALGWLFLAIGIAAALTIFTAPWESGWIMLWVRDWIWVVSYLLLPLIVLIFPSGQVVHPRWRPLLWVGGAGVLFAVTGLAAMAAKAPYGYFRPVGADEVGHLTLAGLLYLAGLALAMITLIGGLISLCIRERRARGPQRRMIRFALVASVLLVAGLLLEARGLQLAWIAAALALPAAASWAIMRYGLFDIDLLIHRSVLFGLLSLIILMLYWATVAVIAREVPGQASFVAAAIVVIAVHPLREGVQRMLDTLLYGVRSRPQAAVDDLGAQLRREGPVSQTLLVVVSSIARALKLPYVGLISQDPAVAPVEFGAAGARPLISIPLGHLGAELGELRVAARSPEERLTRSELAALRTLSLQAGAAAYAVSLAAQLQRARERLVLSREDERRRLRRDLHDGVGPSLAGMTMQVGTAKLYLEQGSPVAAATALLERVEGEMVQLHGDIRRLVRGLRPPALDERGVVAAINETLATFVRTGDHPLCMTVLGGDVEREPLPAAVELAAFRIAVEAATNCARHAQAASCTVSLRRTSEHLEIEIVDDGVGVATHRASGVGTIAMCERAAELGGTCTISPMMSGGTVVRARLPLFGSTPAEASSHE
jgi:signal transduction histidine kinase